MKVIIGGAGIAGLAIGWRLAQAGAEVEILDRGVPGRGATWASAGMLAPGAELGGASDALGCFARDSLRAWPDFAAEIENASGLSIGFRRCGTVIVAETDAAAENLRRMHGELARAGERAELLSADEARARESLLSPTITASLLVPDDARVDNRALGPALAAAAERAGARISNRGIRSLLVSGGRVRGLASDAGILEADAVVLALGAWMNRIGIERGVLPPVAPTKGQMLAVILPSAVSAPNAQIWSDDIYIVPRGGRLVIGASVEDAGFDLSVTRDVCERLRTAAARVVPIVKDSRIAEAWAGLRPRTPDEAPVLGETRMPGLYVAGGQFRNGILFAPLIAERIAAILLHKEQSAAFSDPKRFAAA